MQMSANYFYINVGHTVLTCSVRRDQDVTNFLRHFKPRSCNIMYVRMVIPLM